MRLWKAVGDAAFILLVAALAIVVGVWSMILFSALMSGLVDEMVRGGLRALPGEVQIHHPDYRDDPSVANSMPAPSGDLAQLGNAEAKWHTDTPFVEQPPAASILHALEIPPTGGNTSFMNMYAVLEALPAELLAKIEGSDPKLKDQVVVVTAHFDHLGIGNPKRIYVMRKQLQGRSPERCLNLLGRLLDVEAALKRGAQPGDAFRDGLLG